MEQFPLLSKCMWLQALCVESGEGGGAVELPAFPGGAEAFEACAKFCYGVAVTIGPHNVVAVRCAAARLGMSEAADRGNLAGKLDAFLSSCLLRRWKDALAVLHSTRRYAALCEELGVTSRCVDAVAALAVADPSGDASGAVPAGSSSSSPPWWVRDISELGVDLYWRVMVTVKATGTVHGKAIGDALKAYARRWLPIAAKNHHAAEQTAAGGGGGAANAERATKNHRLLVEKIVSLLPAERNAVSCGFLLKLLKAANILGASPASKEELTRRVASQLEDANVSDLLIPATPPCAGGALYDVDAVVTILEEFALRQAAASGRPEGSPGRAGRHRRSMSAESGELEGARRSTSMAAASHGAMVRVGKLVDGFLAVVATKDARTPLDKMIAVAEAVPDFARPEHDDLYRAIDTYLRVCMRATLDHADITSPWLILEFLISLSPCAFASVPRVGAPGDGQELEEEAVQGAQLQEALGEGVHARGAERAAPPPRRRAGALLRERARRRTLVRARQPRRRALSRRRQCAACQTKNDGGERQGRAEARRERGGGRRLERGGAEGLERGGVEGGVAEDEAGGGGRRGRRRRGVRA